MLTQATKKSLGKAGGLSGVMTFLGLVFLLFIYGLLEGLFFSGDTDHAVVRASVILVLVVFAMALLQTRAVAAMADEKLGVADSVFESQNCMVVTDARNLIVKVNHAFTDCTGYQPEEVIGQDPRVLGSGRHEADFFEAMWKSLKQTGEWQGEIWNRRKNGEAFPGLLSISTVKSSAGEVVNYVASFTDISRLKAAEDDARNLFFYDPVTSLPNRRMLVSLLRRIVASNARARQEGALLIIDVDDMKTLNDTRGHHMGDMLLQQVAQRLHSVLRENDTVARIGGDEFVVVIEDAGSHMAGAAEQAKSVGNSILDALNQPIDIGSYEYRGSACIGVTLFNGRQKVSELLKEADIALHHAQKAGRNTIHFFDPQMQEAINSRAALLGDLGKALERRQFRLYYQVQVDGLSFPIGAEALIRWVHPERGLVSPLQFISLAEETGEIISIGNWVLEEACAQIKAWQQDHFTRDLVLAVNVSARQFRQPDFAGQVRTILGRHAINPKLLKLELTESVLLDDVAGAIETIAVLKRMGVSLSLDDFGTGYSSLQYLARMPLDQLKIDQAFVRDMAVNPASNAVVGTIVSLANNLGMSVIAEGVETEAQRQLLIEKGCTNFQGYLYSKPVPAEQFEAVARELCSQRLAEQELPGYQTSLPGFYPDQIKVPATLFVQDIPAGRMVA